MKKVFIARGLPGSGKSTRVREMSREYLEQGISSIVCSSDHFFECYLCGAYNFDASKLRFAHQWCQEKFRNAVANGVEAIFVDNTNVTAKECRPYVEAALAASYKIAFLEPITPWAFDVDQLTRRNQHGVPREAIERMLGRWVYGMTVEMATKSDEQGGEETEDEKAAAKATKFWVKTAICEE